jgi:hypothetical protein
MSWIDIIVGLIIFIITIYVVYYNIYQKERNNVILSTLHPLNEKKEIFNSTDALKLLTSSGMTVFGFFNINDGDRTVDKSKPFIPILYIENNWYLEITPYLNNQSTARLRIKMNNPDKPEEIIELPPIPKQKWTLVAILRDGRRFDVIYDQKIVASHRLEHYPVVITSPLFVGNRKLAGKVIHVITINRRLTPSELEKERLRRVDTNNMVVDVDSINNLFPSFSVFGQCLPGLPCKPITKPYNNLYEWNTPYA